MLTHRYRPPKHTWFFFSSSSSMHYSMRNEQKVNEVYNIQVRLKSSLVVFVSSCWQTNEQTDRPGWKHNLHSGSITYSNLGYEFVEFTFQHAMSELPNTAHYWLWRFSVEIAHIQTLSKKKSICHVWALLITWCGRCVYTWEWRPNSYYLPDSVHFIM